MEQNPNWPSRLALGYFIVAMSVLVLPLLIPSIDGMIVWAVVLILPWSMIGTAIGPLPLPKLLSVIVGLLAFVGGAALNAWIIHDVARRFWKK